MLILAAVASVMSAQTAFAQRVGGGLVIGVGPNVRPAPPARAPAYVIPSYSDGNYVVPTTPPTATPFSGGFVPPPVIARPPINAPNYYLPGDLYARSTYYVPANATPIVTYPAPTTPGGIFLPSGRVGGRNQPFSPFNGR